MKFIDISLLFYAKNQHKANSDLKINSYQNQRYVLLYKAIFTTITLITKCIFTGGKMTTEKQPVLKTDSVKTNFEIRPIKIRDPLENQIRFKKILEWVCDVSQEKMPRVS